MGVLKVSRWLGGNVQMSKLKMVRDYGESIMGHMRIYRFMRTYVKMFLNQGKMRLNAGV